MRTETLWIGIVALCWGAYPLVARSAGFDGPRGALLLHAAGFLPIVIAASLSRDSGWPAGWALAQLLVAGVMMGSGLLAFYAVANSSMDASVSIPIVDVAMLMVSALGAILFFAEPLTLQKGVGVALMLAGIVMIRPT